MLIYGHRGLPRQAPENSLSGFTAAAQLEVDGSRLDGVELDVTLLADGTPVVSHDDRLRRCCLSAGRLSQLQPSQLAGLNAAACWPAWRPEPVPTLAAVIDQLNHSDLALNLELKDYGFPPSQVVQAVLPLLEQFQRPQHLLISSFSLALLKALRQQAPAFQRGLLYRRLPAHWHTDAQQIAPRSLHLDWHTLTPAQADQIRAAGYALVLWTLDEPEKIAPALLTQARIVISNQPEVLLRYRSENNRHIS